jgi:hypothetical protein
MLATIIGMTEYLHLGRILKKCLYNSFVSSVSLFLSVTENLELTGSMKKGWL